ncbi:MAG TPA: hypothetical protein VHU40_18995 [Polyangia bacterium]|nr:hypothetical protein [Polyangia bacterium]
MTPRSLLTTHLVISIAAALGGAACDRALPIGSIPGEFHPHHPDGSGGVFGSGGALGSGGVFASGGVFGSGGAAAPDGGFGTDGSCSDTNAASDLRTIAVEPGWYHACALLSDRSVRCWGDNQLAELGAPAVTCGKNIVAGLSDVASVVSDYVYSCALDTVGVARCWGSNIYGQFGNGTTGANQPPTVAFGGLAVQQLSLGEYHACALYADGHVACAGAHARTSDGSPDDQHTPVAVPGLSNVIQVEAGSTFTCALLGDHSVSCWGDAQIVDPCASNAAHPIDPTPVGVSNVVKISAGGSHACALLVDGTVTCWGRNTYGQLGTDAPASQTCDVPDHRPIVIPALAGVRDVSAGDSHTCALMNDGTVRCWGYNQYGQLGDGTTVGHQAPAPVAGLVGVRQLASGYMDTCAILTDGRLDCWGALNPFFSTEMSATPTPVVF